MVDPKVIPDHNLLQRTLDFSSYVIKTGIHMDRYGIDQQLELNGIYGDFCNAVHEQMENKTYTQNNIYQSM